MVRRGRQETPRGRQLAYVDRWGVGDLGEIQVKKGWAKPYIYEKRFRRLASNQPAQRKAKRKRLGVYVRCEGRF